MDTKYSLKVRKKANKMLVHVNIVYVQMYTYSIYEQKNKKNKKEAHLVGLEPTTFRLTAERANRLRHRCSCVVGPLVITFVAAARNKDNSWPEELIALMHQVRNSENKEQEEKPKPQSE